MKSLHEMSTDKVFATQVKWLVGKAGGKLDIWTDRETNIADYVDPYVALMDLYNQSSLSIPTNRGTKLSTWIYMLLI